MTVRVPGHLCAADSCQNSKMHSFTNLFSGPMKTPVYIAILLLCALKSAPLRGQEVFLHEFDLMKDVWRSERWVLHATGNWKHIYNEVGWSRIGLSPALDHLRGSWTFSTGINSSYTFDPEIDAFWEIRPWVSVGYQFLLLRRIEVGQRILSEWREFVSTESDRRANYHRFRYKVRLGFQLWDDPRWSQAVSLEWYFLDSPAAYERFPNERDYRLTFIHRLPNSHALTLGLEAERYLYSDLRADGLAVLFILGYRL